MTMKVCLLVREKAMHWAPFYIQAFREVFGEVVSIGEAFDAACFQDFGWHNALNHVMKNDIVTDTDDALEALALLPKGWTPDLVVAIQSGGAHYRNIPQLTCPTAYISVDTWHSHDEFYRARHYDFVFVAQRVFLPYFQDTGCRHVHWLPLAAAPEAHCPVPAEEDHDFTFVGSIGYVANRKRRARLEELRKHFSVLLADDQDGNGMSACYARGRLGFNSSIAQDVNMRVFEVMAMGRPLFTNRSAAVNGLNDLFTEGVHFIGYDDGDMLQQAQQYLTDADARTRIAQAGRAEILAKHLYTHRVQTLVDTIQTACPNCHPGAPAAALVRQGDRLSAYLPRGAASLLDVGLRLDKTRIALRRQGFSCVNGVADTEQEAETRRGGYHALGLRAACGASYDAVDPGRVYDVVCAHAPYAYGGNLDQTVRNATHVLSPGGTLLLEMSMEDIARFNQDTNHAALDAWLDERGYHLLAAHPLSEGFLIQARTFKRTIHEISYEIYDRFPPNAE